MSLLFEKYHPVTLGIISAILYSSLSFGFPSSPEALLSSTISAAAILTGFLMTSKSLIMTMNSPSFDRLRKSGYMKILLTYLKNAIYACLFICVLSLISFFVPLDHKLVTVGSFIFRMGDLWIGSSILAILSFVRIHKIMFSALTSD